MLVELEKLKANPLRDFTVDPIDPLIVEALKHSIEDHGFWGGVMCRQQHDGSIEIAAGHHRVQAAIEAGLQQADICVRQDVDDVEMVRIYAAENGTQRGNNSTALAGTVASAARFLTKFFLTRSVDYIVTSYGFIGGYKKLTKRQIETIKGNIETGIGLGGQTIYDFLNPIKEVKQSSDNGEPGEPHTTRERIPGLTLNAINEQLATLKASGNYTRMVHLVEEEIAQEDAEAFAAAQEAERERQRLLQEELDAQAKRLQAEQEQREAQARAAAAREVEERARREAIAKMREVERKEAIARAELAEKRRKEAEAKQQELEALRHKTQTARISAHTAATKASEKTPLPTFDFEGVARHLKNAHQVEVFREIVTGPGVQPYLPVADQAALAEELLVAAERQSQITKRHVEVTGAFIREQVIKLLLQGKDSARAEAKEEHEALLRADIIQRAEYYMDQFVRNAYGMASVGKRLADLCKGWPDDVTFPTSPEFAKVFANVQQILYDIDHALQARLRS